MKTIPRHTSSPAKAISSSRKVLGFVLLVLTLIACINVHADLNIAPPVTFSVEPEENGKLVYLPVAAPTANDQPSNLLGLRLRINNNVTNDLTLTQIRITFTTADAAVFSYQFTRDVVIVGTNSVTDYLSPSDPDERIQLPATAPVSVKVEIFIEGYALPKMVQRDLAAYEAPVPGGKYLFPANESDLGPEEYFSHVDPHTGGSQFFGYDLHVRGWNGQQFSAVKAGGDANKNEDRVGWKMPIYAMAEGVVLRASLGREDNPAPGKRVIQRMGEASANAITDVEVTKLSATRAASVARRPNGTFEITAWDVQDLGRDVEQLGSVSGEAADLMATDALSGSRLVTAFRTGGGNLRVVVWDVSTNGMTITRRDDHDDVAVQEISLFKLSGNQFVTAVRTPGGNLRVIVWGVSSDGLTVSSLSQDTAGAASSISVTALSSTRFATSLRNGSGRLMVIVWDVSDNGSTLTRRGDATDEFVTTTVAATVSGAEVDTAARTAVGDLRLVRWSVSEDGLTVNQTLEADAGTIQDVALSPNFESSVLTTVIGAGGNLKHILWKPPGDNDPPGLFVRWGEADAGPTDAMDIDVLDTALHFNAVRTATGDLKVICWYVGSGGGNCLFILHGNCRVLYAHFAEGTVSPDVTFPGARVAAGQFLGRMGNSGSSEGPHTHIHAERISSFLTPEEAIELEAQDELTLLGIRPIPFHCARAVRLSNLQTGGDGNPANPFSTLSGHGLYFAQFAVRPTWLKEMYVDWTASCLAPTGRITCTPAGPFDIGGPFHNINQALNESCWGHQLFIRSGSYNEDVTFRRAMTVRSYNGVATIGQ